MEERGKPPGFAGSRRGEIGDRMLAEEYREEVSGARNLMCHTGFGQRLRQQIGEAVGIGIQRRVHRVTGVTQGGQTGGHRDRISR